MRLYLYIENRMSELRQIPSICYTNPIEEKDHIMNFHIVSEEF